MGLFGCDGSDQGHDAFGAGELAQDLQLEREASHGHSSWIRNLERGLSERVGRCAPHFGSASAAEGAVKCPVTNLIPGVKPRLPGGHWQTREIGLEFRERTAGDLMNLAESIPRAALLNEGVEFFESAFGSDKLSPDLQHQVARAAMDQ